MKDFVFSHHLVTVLSKSIFKSWEIEETVHLTSNSEHYFFQSLNPDNSSLGLAGLNMKNLSLYHKCPEQWERLLALEFQKF